MTPHDFDVLTFDCYGTLIDWESGLRDSLRPVLDRHGIDLPDDQRLELFGELEVEAERGDYRPYRDVLRRVLEGFGARLGFAPSESELRHFSESVRDWPAFPDSAPALQALKRRYKLAIISNVDDDLFVASAQRLATSFDWVITAQQAQSYKPDPTPFQMALARIGRPKARVLHVAQSLFHDIAPARALGLSTVWVNRRHAVGGFGATPPAQADADLEVQDLLSLAAVLGVT